MPKNFQKGFAPIAVLIILAAGLMAGLYLSQHTQIFKPRAAETTTIPADVKAICEDAVLKVSWPKVANESKYNVRAYKTADSNFTAVDSATSKWTDGKNLQDIAANSEDGTGVTCDSTTCNYKTSVPPEGGQYRVWVKAGDRIASKYQNVYAEGLVTCTIPRFVVTCDGQKVHIERVGRSAAEEEKTDHFQFRFDNTSDAWDGTCTSENGDFCNENIPALPPYSTNTYNYDIELNLPIKYKVGSIYQYWYAPVYKDGKVGVSSEIRELSCDKPLKESQKFNVYCDEKTRMLSGFGEYGQNSTTFLSMRYPTLRGNSLRLNNLADGWDGSCNSANGDLCFKNSGDARASGFKNVPYIPGNNYEFWMDRLDGDGNSIEPNPTHYFFKCGDGSESVDRKVPPAPNPRPVASCSGNTVTVDIVGDNLSKYDLRLDNLSDSTPWNGSCSSPAGDLCKNGMTNFKTSFEIAQKGNYNMWYESYDKAGNKQASSTQYKFTCQ